MLFKKINDYIVRRSETIPSPIQSSFLKRLSDLLQEGYTFHESVSMLLPFHVKNSDVVIQKMTQVHKNGLSVTEVFRLLGFPDRLLLPINLATTHGKLQETVSVLSVQAAIFEKARKRLNSLLMYPLFLFVVIFLLFTIFKIYFLPNMESLLHTRATEDADSSIIWTSVLLQLPNYFLIGLLFFSGAMLFLVKMINRKKIEVQISLYLKIPLVNKWYRLFLTRVFSREMGGLLDSGMSLQQAFDSLIKQEEHKTLQYIAMQMKEKLVHGESFSNALLLLDHFTNDFHQFVTHGELSGYLGRELSLYSEFVTETIEAKLSKYLSILQPTLFLILAIFIVGAYLAIMLPIYEMINIV
ncbi:competence type IV pilus assembly protein ComGB [Psychrobacillus sp. FJAT-51614]|uniref:Competence type IV pilus assembly protein ComGB n=1 Tax=Psychrobacillus mangrovi TaxID=3117745 RepID=A0ABU8FBJ3_9BACI